MQLMPTNVQETIGRLLAEAKASEAEQRSEPRYPFFRAVSISTADHGGREFSAFSRDISAGGIGMLHNMPLPCGQVTLSIDGKSQQVSIPSEIVWCRSCGEGWYLSGARFRHSGATGD